MCACALAPLSPYLRASERARIGFTSRWEGEGGLHKRNTRFSQAKGKHHNETMQTLANIIIQGFPTRMPHLDYISL